MKVTKINATDEALLDGASSAWRGVREEAVELMPSPVGMAEDVSPFMALSEDHGKVGGIKVRLASNGATLSIRLSWDDADDDSAPDDLDAFADGAAVMFPLAGSPSALSMGSKGAPVNAWLWKADEAEPMDVVAQGYATSQRRLAAASGLKAAASFGGGGWTLVFQRPLDAPEEFVSFGRGGAEGIAFAVWEGSNKERAGQKSVSGEFMTLGGFA